MDLFMVIQQGTLPVGVQLYEDFRGVDLQGLHLLETATIILKILLRMNYEFCFLLRDAAFL